MSLIENPQELPFPIIHYYKVNQEFEIINKLYFERDYSFNLKIKIENPLNANIEIIEWALGERERQNNNFNWIKPIFENGFYHLDGILPKREIFLKLKIKTNSLTGVYNGKLTFTHYLKPYELKIVMGTVDKFYFENPNQNLIPYIVGYNFEYGITTPTLEKEGGIHPFNEKIKYYAEKFKKISEFETAQEYLNFVMKIFASGINVTFTGDYPDFHYIEKFEKEGSIYGVCSERSIVLISLLRSVGIPSRLVFASGFPVDHVFIESFINGKWINLDPTYGFINKYDGYYVKEVRNLTTLQSFFAGVRGELKKNKNNITGIYPYEEIVNNKYLKENIVITGIGGIKINSFYFLKIKMKWSLFNFSDKSLFIFILDGLNNKYVGEIFVSSLFFNFGEGSILIKLDIKKFSEKDNKKFFKLKVYLNKDKKVIDIYEPGEGLLLENFSI
ncbi:MAG: transglutaminase domain-containing protein [Caldisericia bacterium]|nr:transglutaminase domain-containing protein [Caldisericia bacterium]